MNAKEFKVTGTLVLPNRLELFTLLPGTTNYDQELREAKRNLVLCGDNVYRTPNRAEMRLRTRRRIRGKSAGEPEAAGARVTMPPTGAPGKRKRKAERKANRPRVCPA